MSALNNHQTLAGMLDRSQAVVQAMTREAHLGYQNWHRFIDNTMINWLQDPLHREATANQFWGELYKLYNTPDLIDRFGQGALDLIEGMMK